MKFFNLALILFFISVSANAGIRFGTSGAVKSRVEELDKKKQSSPDLPDDTETPSVLVDNAETAIKPIVFPNPFRPSKGHQTIKFVKLRTGSIVRVVEPFTGELICELKDEDEDGLIVWDVRNRNGADVASGVYLAMAEGEQENRVLKLMIER